MRVLVCGGRDFGLTPNEEDYIFDKLDYYLPEYKECIIISGMAPGVDSVAVDYAYVRELEVMRFPADWDDLEAPGAVIKISKGGKKYNAAAGFIRNKQMLDEGKPDLVIAFQGGPGTKMMKSLTEQAGVELIVVSRLAKES